MIRCFIQTPYGTEIIYVVYDQIDSNNDRVLFHAHQNNMNIVKSGDAFAA